MCKRGREDSREKEKKRSGTFSFFSPFCQIFSMAYVYGKFSASLPARCFLSSSHLPPRWPNFPRIREENARGKCLYTHSIDPFATMEIPCTPPPQLLSTLPCMSHPSHLSSSITPSPLHLHPPFLSFSRTHTRRCRLSSFFLSSRRETPLHPSLTPASPLRLFARTQDEEIVKPVLHYST